MKYMVLVNGKFFVKVEVEGSKGAAEHSILDNFDGITGAQAFDEKDMATEWFVRDWLLNNELISMDELKEKTERYTAAWSEYARTKEALTSKEAEIEELKKQLEELENERYDLKKDELHTYAIAKKANAALNIKD